MRFKVDENLPQELVSDLAEASHDAETVIKEGMAGVADRDLLVATRLENRILLTLEKGIANIRMFSPMAFPGTILFRPNSMGRGEVLKFVRRHLHEALQLELKGCLVVVMAGGIGDGRNQGAPGRC
jgi:predicted nuclease of predicted toxin-antitoxin system